MKTLLVNNEKVRFLLKDFSMKYTWPDVIDFNQDADGNWITSPEILTDPKYQFQKVNKGETTETIQTKLRTECTKEGLTNTNSIAELLQTYAVLIDYKPIPDTEPVKETIERTK